MKRDVLMGMALLLATNLVQAATIPQMINYTGTVQVNGSPVNGEGYFRFALINDHSECQADPPGPNCDAYWSSDATSLDGEAPDNAIKITVTNGLFSIKLGDTNRINYNSTISMPAVPGNVFDHPLVYLRVWFDDGVNGIQRLVPDRQLVAVPFAYRAEVAEKLSGANSVTQENLATGSVTTAAIVNQAVTSDKIANGTITGADVDTSTSLTVAGLQVGKSLLVQTDQGGSMELGGSNTVANPQKGGAPFLDFHFGTGTTEDFNARIVNGADNQLNFQTKSGGYAMTVNAGNVGIGTTAPLAKLEVNGDTLTTSNLNVRYNDGGCSKATHSWANFTVNGSNDTLGIYQAAQNVMGIQGRRDCQDAAADLVLQPQYGNVGIGTTVPVDPLHVVGAIRSNTAIYQQTGNTRVGFLDAAGSAPPTTYVGIDYDETNNIARFDALTGNVAWRNIGLATRGGNVGIGTTTPGVKLDVAGTVAVDYLRVDPQDGVNEGGEIQLVGAGTNGTVQLDNFTGHIRVHTLAAGKQFQVWGGSIYADGTTAPNYFASNVGIGTASPAYTLDLNTASHDWGRGIQLTTPSASLAIRAYPDGVYSTAGGFVIGTDTPDDLVLRTNANAVIKLTSAGNVGIGTIAPTTTLQVAGEISPSSNNIFPLGDDTHSFTFVYAVNGVIQTSDARLKKDILPSDLGLDFINKLRPVSYHWNSGENTDLHYGLIAQETEAAINEVKTRNGTQAPAPEPTIVTHDPESDRYGLNYAELIAPIIKASQEIHNSLTATKSDVAVLEAENAQLKANDAAKDKIISELKARLDNVEKFINSR